jgi:hypothetical protein
MGNFLTFLETVTDKDKIIYPKNLEQLSNKDRAQLPDSEFALPKERKYPINDIAHAKLALEYVRKMTNLSDDRQAVEKAVFNRYPELISYS